MKKRIFKCAILTLLLLLAITLVACVGGDANKDTTETTDTTDTSIDETTVYNGVDIPKSYTMIRGREASFEQNDCFYDVYSTMKSLLGAEPVHSYDIGDNGEFLVETSALILIGSTSYDETAQALSLIDYDEYFIGVIGEKIVITAWDSGNLKTATNKFRQILQEAHNGGLFTFSKDLHIIEKNASLNIIAQAPVFEGGKKASVSIEDCSNNTWIAITKGATKDEFQSYQNKIKSAGYTLYTENEINDNLFYTYTKGDYSIHTYFIDYSGEVRVIASKGATLPATEASAYSNMYNSSITQFGLEIPHSKETVIPQGGMGYMFQLADGSFVIIDGGDGYKEDSDQILVQLMKMAPDPTDIRIAAWILTHGHNDHVGAFRQFAKDYSGVSRIKIESFILNFTVSENQTSTIGTAVMDRTTDYIKQYYPSVKVYKCHTGQKYFIRNAVVEILYTLEDYMPKLTGAFGNLHSVVFSVTVEGQKFVFLADTMRVNCDEMSDRYGTYLKSDFVQVSHHGLNDDRPEAQNGTEEIYGLINPAYALWPSGNKRFNQYKTAPENAYLLTQLSVKKVFVAGTTNTTLILPYNG